MSSERPADFASVDYASPGILQSNEKEMAETDGISIEEIVYHLQPGDLVAWPDRATPCKVVKRYDVNEGRKSTGSTLVYWELKGRGGGTYRLTNWLHWGNNRSDDYDSSNPKGVYPQVRRIGTDNSDGELEAHLGSEEPLRLLARGPWYTADQWLDLQADPADVGTVIYEKPQFDRPRFGDVVGHDEMFDQLLVKGRQTCTWTERRSQVSYGSVGSDLYGQTAVQALDDAQIIAYRVGGEN